MVLYADFLFTDKFTSFSMEDFEKISLLIEAEWSGVAGLWAKLPSVIQQAKVDLCYQYLIAWAYADLYPDRLITVLGNAGMPLTKKRIEDAEVHFDILQVQPGLKMLTTNSFGLKALNLILSAPERMGVYG